MTEKEKHSKVKQCKELILATMDVLDKSGINTERYVKMFSGMSDDEFIRIAKRRLPWRVEQRLFEVEPSMTDIFNAFKVIDKPLLERVNLNYLARDKEGRGVQSLECLVVYVHLKEMKQMLVEKNNTSMDIEKRDMFGMLTGKDKGGKQTDREFESLAAMGLTHVTDEFARPRADAMRAKAQMYNAIANNGYVSEKDITIDKDDSLAKNALNVYMLGANIKSNLVDRDYLAPHTLKNRRSK